MNTGPVGPSPSHENKDSAESYSSPLPKNTSTASLGFAKSWDDHLTMASAKHELIGP